MVEGLSKKAKALIDMDTSVVIAGVIRALQRNRKNTIKIKKYINKH